MPKSKLYRLWITIRNRCNNPNASDYKYYGGRGIRVCRRWSDYKTFAADVGPHSGRGLTLDRKKTNGHYEPKNVRWATRRTQSRNRRYCRLTKKDADKIRRGYLRGVTRQVDIAAAYGVSQSIVSQIIRGKAWT